MQYNKEADGSFSPLKQKSVDTGMGLERMLAVLNQKDNIFETDVFEPLFKIISDNSDIKNDALGNKSARIIADHIRAASVLPWVSNTRPRTRRATTSSSLVASDSFARRATKFE